MLQIEETKGFFQSSDEELFVSPCIVTIFKCVSIILSCKRERIHYFCGASLCKYLVDAAHVSSLFIIRRCSSRLFFFLHLKDLFLVYWEIPHLPCCRSIRTQKQEILKVPLGGFQPDRRKSAKNINNRKLHEVSPNKQCCPLSFETAREWPGKHLAPSANKINQ